MRAPRGTLAPRTRSCTMSQRLIALLLLVGLQNVLARPAQVILLRHAEKPAGESEVHLSERGRARARALVSLLTTNALLQTHGPPVALFAPRFTQHGHSRRPYETLQPLAEHLKLPIQTPCAAQDYGALAQRLRQDPACDGKTVVVCWVHDFLPNLARALGVNPQPAPWKARVYDRVWVVTYHGPAAALTRFPQRLLPGDAAD